MRSSLRTSCQMRASMPSGEVQSGLGTSTVMSPYRKRPVELSPSSRASGIGPRVYHPRAATQAVIAIVDPSSTRCQTRSSTLTRVVPYVLAIVSAPASREATAPSKAAPTTAAAAATTAVLTWAPVSRVVTVPVCTPAGRPPPACGPRACYPGVRRRVPKRRDPQAGGEPPTSPASRNGAVGR